MTQRKMHLVAYLKTGPTANFPGCWRHPQSDLHDIFMPERYEHLARVLEAARFDAGFYADTFGLADTHRDGFRTHLGRGGQITYLDPLAILPQMFRVTKHIGWGTSLSTTFMQPYHLARTVASLDHVSGGRACWNVVTSATEFEAQNYGLPNLPPKEERYDRGDEVLEACQALWDGWDEDALIMNRETGEFADPSKVRYANYEGKYVSTRGPLSIPRSPQGRPVLMQAGASPRGKEFAARWAEMIFCSAHAKEDALKYRNSVAALLDRFDRPPGDCKVLPSFGVVLGETDAIAREKADYLNSLLDKDVVLAWKSNTLGVDLTDMKTEEEVIAAAGNAGIQGSRERVAQQARAEGISFYEALRRPHGVIVGTPKSVADRMEDWFTSGACDGFILWATIFPGMYEEFARLVVPELQRRGLFRTEYAGRTLRENLRNPG